jgi:hypothetical protein
MHDARSSSRAELERSAAACCFSFDPNSKLKTGTTFPSTRKELRMPRTATLHLNNKDNPTMVRVSLPTKITRDELTHLINVGIVDNIVSKHTGCTCLSGTINVLIESEFREALQVSLG